MAAANNNDIPLELRVLSTIKEKKPALRNEFDAVVAVLHCVMRELGFICTSLDEKVSSDEGFDKSVFPEGWNASRDSYSFQYKHSQSTMTFFVKCLLLNDKLLVHGLSKENNTVYSLELNVKEFITEKAALDNPDSLFKDVDQLVSLFKIHITSILLPNLNKPGYEDAPRTQTTTQPQQQQQQPQQGPRRDPLAEPPRNPLNFDPRNDPLRVPGSGRGPAFGGPPFGVGYGDVFPPPMPGFGFPGEMGGNLIGPGHPGFGPRVNDPYANDPFGYAGPARLPRGAVPPGARFDPFGPPPPGPNMPRGGPNFPGPNQFAGPDNDDAPPPGYNDMYL